MRFFFFFFSIVFYHSRCYGLRPTQKIAVFFYQKKWKKKISVNLNAKLIERKKIQIHFFFPRNALFPLKVAPWRRGIFFFPPSIFSSNIFTHYPQPPPYYIVFPLLFSHSVEVCILVVCSVFFIFTSFRYTVHKRALYVEIIIIPKLALKEKIVSGYGPQNHSSKQEDFFCANQRNQLCLPTPILFSSPRFIER